MNRTKRHAFHAITIFCISFILSFVLSCIAGWIQDNSPLTYNVMGITLPGWFYPILAVNAVLYIVAGGKFIMAIAMAALESGAIRSAHSHAAEVISDNDYNGTEVNQPTFTDAQTYDPAMALQR